MLNRRHIRVKVMQSLYSYWSSDGTLDKDEVERDLNKNLEELFNLYLYILLFLRELACFVDRYDDEVKSRVIPLAKEININSRFYQNPIISCILENSILTETLEKHKQIWDPEDNNILRKVFLDLKNNEVYKEYIHTKNEKQLDDFSTLIYITKHYPFNFTLLDQHFEDKFLNWFDDGHIAVHMVTKTLNQIVENPDNENFILPLYANKKDSYEFAINLFRKTIEGNDYFEELINSKIEKWEPSRIMIIDRIILRMGLCEFINFPSIPVKVTINEYIELAKNYSTPNSKKFINGVLDNILSDLKKEDNIRKSGLGLLEGKI